MVFLDGGDRFLADRDSELPHDVLGFSPRRAFAYAKLFLEARRLDIRLVALGLPLAVWGPRIAALAAELNTDPVRTVGNDIGELVARAGSGYEYGFNEAVAHVALSERNESMAGLMRDGLKSGEKGVILVGDGHVARPVDLNHDYLHVPMADYGTLAGSLAEHSLKAYSLTLTGGVFLNASEMEIHGMIEKAYRLVAQVGAAGRAALLPTSEATGIYHMGVSEVLGRRLPSPN